MLSASEAADREEERKGCSGIEHFEESNASKTKKDIIAISEGRTKLS
jgi:hypothetical protein